MHNSCFRAHAGGTFSTMTKAKNMKIITEPGLRVWIKVLHGCGTEAVVPCETLGVQGFDGDEDALVYQSANSFLRGVEVALREAMLAEDCQDFLLVFGESVEDAFYPFLVGSISRELDKLAARKAKGASNQAAGTDGKKDECNVCVLVCPVGKPIWYDAYLWGKQGKPAYAGELAIRVFDKARFDEFKQWCDNIAHAADFTMNK